MKRSQILSYAILLFTGLLFLTSSAGCVSDPTDEVPETLNCTVTITIRGGLTITRTARTCKEAMNKFEKMPELDPTPHN